jgi:hypothetical protein
MDGSVAIPTGRPTVAAAPAKKRGVGSLALIGVLVVLLLGAGAVVFHVSSGNATVTKAIDKIPGANVLPSGWKVLTDAAGGFTVQYPPDPQTTSVTFPAADNGQLTGWQGTIGDAPQIDTELYVIYGKVHPKAGEPASTTITRLGAQKMALDGGYVESKTETTYQGYPAIQYTINRVTFAGQQGFESATMFLKGGNQLFVIESLSRYQDSAGAYSKVLNSLSFNA